MSEKSVFDIVAGRPEVYLEDPELGPPEARMRAFLEALEWARAVDLGDLEDEVFRADEWGRRI